MGIFGGGSSQHENDVEKATSEKNTNEEWGFIMTVCDNAGKTSEDAKNYLRAILKRLANTDPHIAIQAVTLLDACAKNSGRNFRLELASREFENEYQKLIAKSHPKVVQKLKESLRKWAEDEEFKSDPQLNLIPSLYASLKSKGVDFTIETPVKKTVVLSKDPNVVQSQEEEDQIAKAIELSLKETSGSPRNSANTPSLYPSTNLAAANVVTMSANSTPQKEQRKVRALYDFEAAEDNELTFSSGEIIVVIDDSDPNWWKGSNQRGEGLFPANFVTSDLNVEGDQLAQEKKKKLIELDEDLQDKTSPTSSMTLTKDLENIEINEEKINRLLHLLHEADPTNPDQDTQEMLNLEREVNSMGPLIDAELERVDRKHAQLTQLSADLVEALNLYHTLMREPQFPPMTKLPFIGYQPGMQPPPPPSMYNGSMPPNMGPSSMMGAPPFGAVPHGHERPFMHQQGVHFQVPSQGIHPSSGAHLPPMSSMMHSLPMGMTLQQGPPMPPGMHGPLPDVHRMPHSSISGQFPPQGLPSFVQGGFPVNNPHLQSQVQNGHGQSVPGAPAATQSATNFPQPSNPPHMM